MSWQLLPNSLCQDTSWPTKNEKMLRPPAIIDGKQLRCFQEHSRPSSASRTPALKNPRFDQRTKKREIPATSIDASFAMHSIHQLRISRCHGCKVLRVCVKWDLPRSQCGVHRAFVKVASSLRRAVARPGTIDLCATGAARFASVFRYATNFYRSRISRSGTVSTERDGYCAVAVTNHKVHSQCVELNSQLH